MTAPTFRCGWRIQRYLNDQHPFVGETVSIRRGEFRMDMWPEVFDNMSDTSFAERMARAYREHTFEQASADLDTLARYVTGALVNTAGIFIATDVSTDEIKAALYRWDRARRDMEGET